MVTPIISNYRYLRLQAVENREITSSLTGYRRYPKVMLSRRPEIHEGPPMKLQTQNMCNNDRSNNNNNNWVVIEIIT